MKSIFGVVGIVYLALVVGWIMNIVKLVQSPLAFAEFGALEICRIIGIFVPPMGGVLGFF